MISAQTFLLEEQKGQNVGMEAAFIAAVTVLSITIIGLVIYILWLKRNGKTFTICVWGFQV